MRLYYIHDPMCSWCWAFRPVWQQLRALLDANYPEIEIVYLLGGLAPDSDEPMSAAMQTRIRAHWRRIQQVAPGTEFNFDFWEQNMPLRSTYPACRAVIAAGMQGGGAKVGEGMILAIQQAYYLQARNPSDAAVLIELAEGLGLDGGQFALDLQGAACQAHLAYEVAQAQRIGVRGFPDLIVQSARGFQPIAIDYTSPMPMLKLIGDEAGRQ